MFVAGRSPCPARTAPRNGRWTSGRYSNSSRQGPLYSLRPKRLLSGGGPSFQWVLVWAPVMDPFGFGRVCYMGPHFVQHMVTTWCIEVQIGGPYLGPIGKS